ncbi:hypothetical protein ACHAWF_006304 [Thalassiosira exigua]
MVRKKLDARVRTLFRTCLRSNQRALLVLVGDHGKDQVPNLCQILRRESDPSKSDRVGKSDSVLWCYKKELGFSTHRKKRMEKVKRDKRRGLSKSGGGGGAAADEQADNFELFLTNADITWCYYKDSHRVLGTTHSVLVLQDFEALTPNLMARTVETVRGGGLVIFLLRTVTSLRQLYSMTMDVHSRYRTEGSGDVVPRFNERFILSLGDCRNCLVCDDELNVLPVSRKALRRLAKVETSSSEDDGDEDGGGGRNDEVVQRRTEDDVQLADLKETLRDTPHVGKLVELTKTLDQARAVLTFLEACADRDKFDEEASSPLGSRSSATTVSLTAPRGRGKSAALGLCLAGAVSFGFHSIAVTAPEPENLTSVFRFLVEGLKALKYQEHADYVLGYNYGASADGGGGGGGGGGRGDRGEKAGRDNVKCVVSVTVHSRGKRRQTVRYVRPRDAGGFAGAELVAIDEAAAIPLPVVRGLIRPDVKRKKGGVGGGAERRLAFLSSTVNGYEGTGRALSLKLIKELRDAGIRGRSGADAARAAGAAIAGAASKKGEAKVHERRWAAEAAAAKEGGAGGGSGSGAGPLRELDLSRPIRYAPGDPVEAWLNGLLCLDCDSFDFGGGSFGGNGKRDGRSRTDATKLRGGAPAPAECELYVVDRDALFSYHRLSESFLQKVWGLYTSAHYKNAPNDLQMLSDAPAHGIFVLLGPQAESAGDGGGGGGDGGDLLPDVLAVVQTSLEGKLSRKTVRAQLARGHRSAGDLIPWTMSQQFGDGNFAELSGARVVRVAVHPEVQGMGYGTRAMELLGRYYNGEMVGLGDDEDEGGGSGDEEETPSESSEGEEEEPASGGSGSGALLNREAPKPRKKLPPLLLPLTSVPAPRLDWIGTSFGLTKPLHDFWRTKAGMTMLYLRQTSNELTGEHSAIMIRALPRRSGWDDAWLPAFGVDARRRIGRLLGGPFRGMDASLAMSLLGDAAGGFRSWTKKVGADEDEADGKGRKADEAALREFEKRSGTRSAELASAELHYHLTPHDLQRLELYGRNLCDHHLISDLVSSLAQLYFNSRMGPDFRLSSVQAALLCGIGLQRKSVDDLTSELSLPINQALAMFNKAVKKMSLAFHNLLVEDERRGLLGGRDGDALRKAEANVRRVRDVVGQTLEEDVAEGAAVAVAALNQSEPKVGRSGAAGTRTTPEIDDPEIMKFALKGTDEEWAKALEGEDGGAVVKDGGTVQIKSTQMLKKSSQKRKAESAENVLDSVLKDDKKFKKKLKDDKKFKKEGKKKSKKTPRR